MEAQKTISRDFSLSGNGLQTGKKVEVFFYPEKENKGIIIKRKDLPKSESFTLGERGLRFNADRRSIVGKGKNSVETIEHILASLSALGIDNIRIEMTASEPPALDGSAKVFTESLKKAGLVEQGEEKQYITLKAPVWVEDKEAFLGIFPSDKLKISFLVDFPVPGIGRQAFSSEITPDIFEKQIAPARTIWFVPQGPGSIEQKAHLAQKLGYGKGVTKESVLIIDKEGFVNDARFPDEPVRHKVLDLIGDLYLLGRALKARVIAVRSGHRLNLKLVEKIKKECLCR